MFENELTDAALRAVCEAGGRLVETVGHKTEAKRAIITDIVTVTDRLLNAMSKPQEAQGARE